MVEKKSEKEEKKETRRKVIEVAEGDRDLARGIWATITVAAEFGVDVLKTIQMLGLPKEQLKQIFLDSGRFPNIFLTALIWREVREKRRDKDASK